MAQSVGVLSVNVGQPRLLGRRREGEVWSAIAKQPVTVPELELSGRNLSGDSQADLTVHGGPNKAVYAYPADHFDWWADTLGRPVEAGSFGENLTTLGVTEAEVGIGDTWQWGDAILQVAQPRSPCFKLALHAGTPDVGRVMNATGRTGWYLRVLTPGRVPTRGLISVSPNRAGLTVLDAHLASIQRPAPEALIATLLEHPPLADEWRAALANRLARVRRAQPPPA